MGPTWIKKKNKNQTYVWHPIDRGKEREVMFLFFLVFIIFISFSDSQVSNRQNSSG